ncbi:MAG: RDD family protein [Bacteroidia bacterium]
MSTVKIRTAQNVIVEHNLATLGDRLLGVLLDGIIKFCFGIGLALIVFGLLDNVLDEITRAIIFFVLLLPLVFYSLLLETFLNGQTIGKKAMNTRVVKLDGSPAGFGSYFIRWILKLIDDGVIGILCIAATQYSQRLGDLAAGTVVIKITRKTSLADTLPTFNDSAYEPKFPEAANLNDEQANIIKEALRAYHQEDNYVVVDALSRKLRELLHIQTNMPPLAFLETILKDYSHLHNIR